LNLPKDQLLRAHRKFSSLIGKHIRQHLSPRSGPVDPVERDNRRGHIPLAISHIVLSHVVLSLGKFYARWIGRRHVYILARRFRHLLYG
jgi:hypothetical protein